LFNRLDQLADRLGTYPFWQVGVEFLIIWVVVYAAVRFVQGTRAAGALKGLVFLLIVATLLVRILGRGESFQRLTFLYEHLLTLLAITLLVVFQPELRRGLFRLFETPFFRRAAPGVVSTVDAVVEAAAFLSKAKFGAIVVIERESSLKGLVEGGTVMNSAASARVLQTIFFPGTALHDLAVVISGGEIKAAGVQLPLADPEDMPDPSLGSRHRAAVGLSKESDALIVVVSEETGTISVAEQGTLYRGLTADELRERLLTGLSVLRLTGHESDQAEPAPPRRRHALRTVLGKPGSAKA
jgi:diadenylate cyclase